MEKKNLRSLMLIVIVVFTVSCGHHAQKHEEEKVTTITMEQLAEGVIVEAACGECMFKLPGNGCDLAVRVNGKAYFVDGVDMDTHGDAHAKDGMCSVVREAKVKGQIIDGRFKAETFELLAHDDDHDHDHDHDTDDDHNHDTDDDHDGHSH